MFILPGIFKVKEINDVSPYAIVFPLTQKGVVNCSRFKKKRLLGFYKQFFLIPFGNMEV